MNAQHPDTPLTKLQKALAACRVVFTYGTLIGLISNILMLALPIYSLQVLDRVISSGSIETLMMLTLVVFVALMALELLQGMRSFMLIRMGQWLEERLSTLLFQKSLTAIPGRGVIGSQMLRDFGQLKGFLSGGAINSLIDSPWALVFIIVLYMIHPMNGLLVVIGGVLLLVVAYINERASQPALEGANKEMIAAMQLSESLSRNAEVIHGMGMTKRVTAQWDKIQREGNTLQTLASRRNAFFSSIARFTRFTIQMLVTGMGGYLVLQGEMTVGAMIAGSILAGRALAPFDQAIGSWKQVVSARGTYDRLKQQLAMFEAERDGMSLPPPEGRIAVESLIYSHPSAGGHAEPVIKGVSFSILPGENIGIIGPSASGKSTLARLLLGIWKPTRGTVRLDGADINQWDRDDLGDYVGYLPQDVELFDGSIKDNISRMNTEAEAEGVIAAAKLTGVHDMILRLHNGYDTIIGSKGTMLSAGQRQRVGLARAYYGMPKLVILDEPNANLDQDGEEALANALRSAKKHGITSLVISHRKSVMAAVDKLMIVNQGQLAAFDTTANVLKAMAGKPSAVTTPASVSETNDNQGTLDKVRKA